MLGWTVTLTRPALPVFGPEDPRLHRRRPEFTEYPYLSDDLHGKRIARWFAELGGIDSLTRAENPGETGVAIRLGDFPSIYALPVEQVPIVIDPKFGRPDPTSSAAVDLSGLANVPHSEWLLAEVWDQS